jgi:cobalt-zinc-cadmium efflux system protein
VHLHASNDHARATTRAFAIGVALNAGFVLVESAAGFMSGSLALLADAGHNLSDVLGLLLAWGASYLSRRRPTGRRTYGLRRTSILAALVNALLLYIAVGMIAWEAINRLRQPIAVASATVLIVAAIGVVINTFTALLFMSGRARDLNLRGAFLHMAADAAVSLGVALGGVAILYTGRLWIDPLLSLLIAAVIAYSTWDLLWQAVELTLDSVPRGIDHQAVRDFLLGQPGVTAVHDLHIWGMSTTEAALTAHVVRPDAALDDNWLFAINHELHERFGIDHATIQVETGRGDGPCALESGDAI